MPKNKRTINKGDLFRNSDMSLIFVGAGGVGIGVLFDGIAMLRAGFAIRCGT